MRRLLLLLTALFVLTSLFSPAASAEAAWVWPVKGEVITPYRNGTDPYAPGQHRGIDIAATVGTPVVAAAGGDVRFAGTAGSSGLTVSVRTSDGYDTSYLHLSSLAVRDGARVSPGERIGAVGTSGTRSATAPHLHFGVRDEGTRHAYHDPLAFLPAPPAAPAPEPPAPAPAPAPGPARPAPAPAGRVPATRPAPLATRPAPLATRPAPFATRPAPFATAPSPRTESGRAGRPVPALRVSRSAPATWNPRPARALAQADPQRSVAAHGLDSHPAALGSLRAALGRHEVAAPGSADAALPGHTGSREDEHGRSPIPAASGSRDAASPSQAARAADASVHSGKHGGPSLGWALACGGLLLAAAILGLRDDRSRPRPRTRARLGRALRPLTGGR